MYLQRTFVGTYLAYDKRVKELAAELTTAQVGRCNFVAELNSLILCGERQEDFAELNNLSSCWEIQEDFADLGNLNSTQGQLADYNLLVDKLNTDTERAEIKGPSQNSLPPIG